MAKGSTTDAPEVTSPEGLDSAGRELWGAIHRQLPPVAEEEPPWELSEREVALLTLACHQIDDLARLEVVIEKEGPMAVGSAGQPTVHPAVQEARQGRLAISRLLGGLQLPDDDVRPQTSASVRGRDAARARWGAGIEA